jgi:FKBP-type peptidyl-prolyl cis-trans isomerase SlyD
VLDGNHPLAGMALRFDLELVAVRPATAEELERERAQRADAEPGADAGRGGDEQSDDEAAPDGRTLH